MIVTFISSVLRIRSTTSSLICWAESVNMLSKRFSCRQMAWKKQFPSCGVCPYTCKVDLCILCIKISWLVLLLSSRFIKLKLLSTWLPKKGKSDKTSLRNILKKFRVHYICFKYIIWKEELCVKTCFNQFIQELKIYNRWRANWRLRWIIHVNITTLIYKIVKRESYAI